MGGGASHCGSTLDAIERVSWQLSASSCIALSKQAYGQDPKQEGGR